MITGVYAQELDAELVQEFETEEIEEELIEQNTTTALSFDDVFIAEIDQSNILIKDADSSDLLYTIETPYKAIRTVTFVNPGFFVSDSTYYIAFITDTNLVEMRQLNFEADDLGNNFFYDEIIFSMQGTKSQPAPQEPPQEEPEEIPEETPEEEEKHEYEGLALIRYKNTDTISFKIKVSYIPKPYILGISFAAGFTEYRLIQPFYFGGFLEPHVGIPQKAFPYKYELGGTELNGPLIVGGKIYAPFGICVFPFQENIEFFAEIAPGISANMMWNSKVGKDSITSKVFPAFYASLRTGASWKGFSFFIEGNYDAILGFGVSAGFGYSLNFDLSTTPDHAPSLE